MAKPYNTNKFKEYIFNTVGNEYTLLGEYTTARNPIRIRHNVCNHTYDVRPDDFKHGKRCPKCAVIKRIKGETKTTGKFKEEVYSLVKDEYKVCSEYVRWNVKVKMYHKTCNTYYEVQPNSFLQGRRCPNCKYSRGENLIKEYLDLHNIVYEQQVKYSNLYDKRHLSYDFYLRQYNLLIEYQGRQHYKPVKRYGGIKHLHLQQKHDMMKKEYAINNDIELLEIKYTCNNMEKVSRVLNNKLTELRKAENLHQNDRLRYSPIP